MIVFSPLNSVIELVQPSTPIASPLLLIDVIVAFPLNIRLFPLLFLIALVCEPSESIVVLTETFASIIKELLFSKAIP